MSSICEKAGRLACVHLEFNCWFKKIILIQVSRNSEETEIRRDKDIKGHKVEKKLWQQRSTTWRQSVTSEMPQEPANVGHGWSYLLKLMTTHTASHRRCPEAVRSPFPVTLT